MTSKERFLRYIAYHTTSSQTSQTSPSTERQLVLSQALAEEMRGMGLRNVYVDGSGNVSGTLPATEGAKAPVLGFIAHIDTSPDASGENVQAQEVLYDGSEIELGHGVTLSETQFPAMAALRGQVLLVTDGSTLLGADDKAGVAEIMTMAEKLIREEIPHGEIRLEIGRASCRERV